VSVQHTARTGKTYYLHEKETAAGKHRYFFSLQSEGRMVSTIPEGYEIFENVNGQVFLRQKSPQVILPDELAAVETALRKHGESWRFRAEVKKNTITVYQADDLSGLDKLAAEFGRRPLAGAEKARFANYMAYLRFTLVDKKGRTFITERFCFRGSVDDWIHIGGPGSLTTQVNKFVKHLGQESFYELF